MKNLNIATRLLVAIGGLFGTVSAAAEPAVDLPNNPAVVQFRDWQDVNALPAIALDPAGTAAGTAGGNRIGGPVWLAEGEEWPVDSAGTPLSFLAQVDFAELPSLPDYPSSGVLQFFIARDDLYGANFEVPENGQFKVIFREDLSGPGRLETSKPLGRGNIDDYSPLYDSVVNTGVALTPRSIIQRPSLDSWLLGRDLGALMANDLSSDAIYDWVESQANELPSEHHVGGHPGFTQSDWREVEPYQNVDRVLLQLWSGDDLMWGDSGQGQFMIRREDLLKRDFSKVFYQWDCY